MENADRLGLFKEAVLAFLKEGAQRRIDAARERLQKVSEERRAAAAKKYEAQVRLAELRADKELIGKEALKNKNFEEDFEAIMLLEGVRKIQALQNKLIIYSKRIFQHVESKQQTYDIGQHDIHITFSPSGFFRKEDISFIKGNYPGKFRHPHAQEQNTCFGNERQPGGLNESIDKLMAGFDLVNLAAYLLAFLRRDDAEPALLAPPPNDKYHPSADQGYQSQEEREGAKAAFVELCKGALLSKLTALTDAAIRSAEEEISRTSDTFLRMRNAEEELRLTIAALERKLGDDLPAAAEQEAEALAADKRAGHIRRQEGSLIISFVVNNMHLTLEISPNQTPKVRRPSEETSLGPRFTRQGQMKLLEENTDFGKAERKRIARLQAEGGIFEIFKFFADALEKSWDHTPEGGAPNEWFG